MGNRDRPRIELLLVLLTGFGVIGEGVLLRATSWSGIGLSALQWGPPILLLLAVAAWLLKCRFTLDDLRGVSTPLAVIAAVAVAFASVIQPFGEGWIWAQLLVVLAAAGVAVALAAVEWTQRWLVVTLVALVALVAAFTVRVGFRAERDAALTEPVAEAIAEKTALTATAAEAASAKAAELAAAAETARAGLEEVLPNSSAAFRATGEAILAGLTPARRATIHDDVAHLLALPVSADMAAQDLEVRAAAPVAVAAFDASAAGANPPSTGDVDAAITAACATVRDAGFEVHACGDLAGTMVGGDPSVVLHRLDIALAYYRAAVSPDDESLEDAAAAAAATEPEELETSLLAAAQAGPEAILASINDDSAMPLVPGQLGWVIAGALAVWAVRRLFKLNALQMPGPVTISHDGDHNAELRIAVLKNLKTPAAAPGSSVVQSITDLTAVAGVEASIAGKILSVLTSLLSGDRGYIVEAEVAPPPEVEAEVAPPPEADTAPPIGASAIATAPTTPAINAPTPGPATTVLVRVSAADSKESLGSASFVDKVPEKAMRSAGLWAAGFLLGRSTRIPSWASWTERTAQSLEATTTDSPTLPQLAAAARAAPTSGWVLQLYGNELELAGREREAVAVYARAVVAHPRYLIARYRLAAALGMLGRDPGLTSWNTAPLAERSAIITTVAAACRRLGINASRATALNSSTTTKDGFHTLACDLLASIEEDSAPWNHLAGKLRRADRDTGWLAWGRRSDRLSTLWLARSGRLVYDSEQPKLVKVREKAKQPSSTWQLSYNLACVYAGENPDEALLWLETCLMRPDIQELNAQWVGQDTDLAPIASHPRFIRFREQLEQRSDA